MRLNRIKAIKYKKKLYMPVFVEQHPKLREVWIKKWEELVVNSFDISESILLPDSPVDDEQSLDRVIKAQSQYDIDQMIKESQSEYK